MISKKGFVRRDEGRYRVPQVSITCSVEKSCEYALVISLVSRL